MDCSIPGIPLFLGLCSNSCPLSWWCHPTISSSVTPFSFGFQSFPASESFPMSWLFTSGGQSIGTSASGLVLPKSIQSWFPLRLTGLLPLLYKELSRVFSSTTISKASILLLNLKLQLKKLTLLYGPTLTSIHDYRINHSFNYLDLCWQSDVSLFNRVQLFATSWTI